MGGTNEEFDDYLPSPYFKMKNGLGWDGQLWANPQGASQSRLLST